MQGIFGVFSLAGQQHHIHKFRIFVLGFRNKGCILAYNIIKKQVMSKEKEQILDMLRESENFMVVFTSKGDGGTIKGTTKTVMIPVPESEEEIRERYYKLIQTMLKCCENEGSFEGHLLNTFCKARLTTVQAQMAGLLSNGKTKTDA